MWLEENNKKGDGKEREREGKKSIRNFKTLHGTADASSRRDGGTKRVGVKKKKEKGAAATTVEK